MIFYVSNTHDRGLDPTKVLHVDPECLTLRRADRRAWEATPSEIRDAYALCGKCAPSKTAIEDPDA